MRPISKIHVPFLLAVMLAVGFSVVSSVAFGWLDGRWANKPDIAALAQRLEQVPQQVGDWSLVEDRELENAAEQTLRCYGYAYKVYQNSRSGARVNVAILFGPRGPIAVHTPEICYSGQGVQAQGDRRRVHVASTGNDHQLWEVAFLSTVDLQPTLEVHYAWSDGGPWLAAEQPRFWLTDRLYKIQVAGPPTIEGQESESMQFLELFLEQIQPLIEAPSTKS